MDFDRQIKPSPIALPVTDPTRKPEGGLDLSRMAPLGFWEETGRFTPVARI